VCAGYVRIQENVTISPVKSRKSPEFFLELRCGTLLFQKLCFRSSSRNDNTHLLAFFLAPELLQLQPFYSSLNFVRDNPGEPAPEETFTHSHLLWSSIIPYLLAPFFTIHGILPVQLSCLTVFLHNLCPSFLWSTSWPSILHFIPHTFIHPVIVFFSQHMPIPSQPVLLKYRDYVI